MITTNYVIYVIMLFDCSIANSQTQVLDQKEVFVDFTYVESNNNVLNYVYYTIDSTGFHTHILNQPVFWTYNIK